MGQILVRTGAVSENLARARDVVARAAPLRVGAEAFQAVDVPLAE